MLIECIEFALARDRQIDVERCCANAALSLDGSLHCRGYELALSSGDPSAFVFRIEWTSVADRRSFRTSGAFVHFATSLMPLTDCITTSRFYETTRVTHRR